MGWMSRSNRGASAPAPAPQKITAPETIRAHCLDVALIFFRFFNLPDKITGRKGAALHLPLCLNRTQQTRYHLIRARSSIWRALARSSPLIVYEVLITPAVGTDTLLAGNVKWPRLKIFVPAAMSWKRTRSVIRISFSRLRLWT